MRAPALFSTSCLVSSPFGVEQALAAYNAGDFRVKDWLSHASFRDSPEFVESIPFRETRLYVETVMRDEVVYRRLLSGSPRFLKCGQSAN